MLLPFDVSVTDNLFSTGGYICRISVTEVPGDPDRITEKNKMTFYNVSISDAQVIQCNATNKHGYIFQNAYLNVLSKCSSAIWYRNLIVLLVHVCTWATAEIFPEGGKTTNTFKS